MSMRIDQFLSLNLNISRQEAKKLIRKKCVRINEQYCLKATEKVGEDDSIHYQQTVLSWPKEQYWLLHKPANYCCSHVDDGHPSVFNLLPPSKKKLHIAGRLDADTTGLLLISSDGKWCHRITSPKQKNTKQKTYQLYLQSPLSTEDIQALEEGILLRGEKDKTLAAHITVLGGDKHYQISICEGRYHQVKRMFGAVGNKVLSLHRAKIAALVLDDSLPSGHYRPLTADEIDLF